MVMADWRRACALEEVKEGSPLSVTIDDKLVGIFRVGGELFAMDDVCPHEFALLSTGFQEGDTIECPLHQAIFDIKTGENLTPPAPCGVQTYPVRINGNDVLVDIASPQE